MSDRPAREGGAGEVPALAFVRGALLHGRARWLIAVVGACLAVPRLSLGRLPEASEARVADLLSRAIAGEVASDEYVWEPSQGVVADMVEGRGVVFLGRAAAGAPRDVYRARVRVTHDGRPLETTQWSRLTDTPYGDERELAVRGGRAAFATHFDGGYQSLTIAPLDGASPQRVLFPQPAAALDFELGEAELVLVRDREASAVDLASLAISGGAPLEVVAVVAESPQALPRPYDPEIGRMGGAAPPPFQPEVVYGEGAPPAVASQTTPGGTRAVVLDGRQLDFVIVPGTSSPTSATGFAGSGRLPPQWRGRRIDFAMEIPAPRGPDYAGLYQGQWVAPLREGALVLAGADDATLALGRWALPAWERPRQPVVVEWSGAHHGPGRHAVCLTPRGDFAIAWSPRDDEGEVAGPLPECTSSILGWGPIENVQWGEAVAVPERSERTLLLASRHDWGPHLAAPEGLQWSPSAEGQPDPAFIPAVHTIRVDSLGAEVTVYHIDSARFDWELVAGERERKHRLGGAFPEALGSGRGPHAKLALGLGVGKRKDPRGLRMKSSTGLTFTGKGGVLALTPEGPRLGSATDPSTVGDATELPLTVEDGEVTRAARDRGPLQLRADVCTLPGGTVLVAVATFDSHETTATTLANLGCERVAALDRGSESPAHIVVGPGASGPGFPTTTLVGVERHLPGRVRRLAAP